MAAIAVTTDSIYNVNNGARVVFDVSGTPYVVLFYASTSLRVSVFKKTGGVFGEQDSANRPSGAAGDLVLDLDTRLVGTTLHITYIDYISIGAERHVKYVTFDCLTDQWGSPETVYTFSDWPALQLGCRIDMDSGGFPHVIFVEDIDLHGTPYAQVLHIHKTGGGWQASERVSTTDDANHKVDSVVMDSTDRFCVIYHIGGTVLHRSRSSAGAWDTEGTVHAAGQNLSTGPLHSIAVDSSDVRKVAIIDNLLNLDVRSGTSGANPTWSDDGTDLDASIGSPSMGVVSGGTDRYVTYQDTVPSDRTIRLAKRENGSWTDALLESQSGKDLRLPHSENPVRVGPRFHYVFNNLTDRDWCWNEYGVGGVLLNVSSKLVLAGMI